MNASTRLSAKGQVVIPKEVRDRLGLVVGDAFDVIDRGNEVLLRRQAPTGGRLSIEAATSRLRALYRYAGPPSPVSDLGWSPDAEDD